LELLKPDGRVISGLPCIYHVQTVILYSEAVREDGETFIFDPEKTCALLFGMPTPDGKQAFQAVKGFGPQIPLRPSYLRVGKNAVIITDCTDPNVTAICKRTISGIILAGPSALPPEDKRN
jgi:hypothetical protein